MNKLAKHRYLLFCTWLIFTNLSADINRKSSLAYSSELSLSSFKTTILSNAKRLVMRALPP